LYERTKEKTLLAPNFFFAAIVVCFCVVLVFATVIPNIIPRQSGVNPIGVCRNNLRNIDAAKNEWMLENNKKAGDLVTANDIKSYIKLDPKGNLPKCLNGGNYTIGRIGENPTCSFHGDLLGTNSP
jgi:hypothetical protein